MSIVSKFIIDSKTIDVADETARSTANTANSVANAAKLESETNKSDIAAIKELPRFTVAYTESSQSITFTNQTHTS